MKGLGTVVGIGSGEGSKRMIRLVHWNADEMAAVAETLLSSGYEVVDGPMDMAEMRRLRKDPPASFIIDLGRRPSVGRDLGLNLRKAKATRHVPLVFIGGEPPKVEKIRRLLPDAVYATPESISRALRRAIENPPSDPVVPKSVFEPYAETPLPKKLGIAHGMTVVMVGAPEGFESTLGELPEGTELRREPEGEQGLTMWFVRSREDLESDIERMGAAAEKGGLWIIWPKKASGMVTDLSQVVVREVGLASGLVDFKICSLDKTWSGLRFTIRKSPQE